MTHCAAGFPALSVHARIAEHPHRAYTILLASLRLSCHIRLHILEPFNTPISASHVRSTILAYPICT